MEVSGHLHTPAALPPCKSPSTHWIEGWVGPRAGLGAILAISVIETKLSGNHSIFLFIFMCSRCTSIWMSPKYNFVYSLCTGWTLYV
jgi:hypothetical protein